MERPGGEEQASCDFWLEIAARKNIVSKSIVMGETCQYLLMVPSSQLPVQGKEYLLKTADSHFISMGQNS